jgi:hypoxanthine phosphoribosyltransferase
LSSVEETRTKAKPFEIILDKKKIADRVAQLGRQITTDYAGQTIVLIGMLKGCMVFMSDLMRSIGLMTEIEFISARDNRQERTSQDDLCYVGGQTLQITGRHVLIVEGIVDTGRTAAMLLEKLKKLEPASLEVVTLLDKPASHRVKLNVKYKGFSVGNDFVIGFGLDNAGAYRNLPYVGRMID